MLQKVLQGTGSPRLKSQALFVPDFRTVIARTSSVAIVRATCERGSRSERSFRPGWGVLTAI
jgi:hypothetical protein